MEQNRLDEQNQPLKNNDKPVDGSEQQNEQGHSSPRRGSTGMADRINNIISSPTAAVRNRTGHHDSSLRDTGTFTSYEGQTAPGAGGSVGTGQASGQSATGSRITGADQTEGVGSHHQAGEREQGTNHSYNDKRDAGLETGGSGNPLQRDHDDALDRDTLGTP